MVTNIEEQKKAEKKAKKEAKKAERAKMKKSEKYNECRYFFLYLGIGLGLISLILAFTEEGMLYITIIPLCISGLLEIVFLYLSLKERKREDKRELEIKESLINKLNKKEFKEIKLKKQNNKYFNAFLNNTIKAKIHPDNDEIVILSFCFVDDLDKSCCKSVPFSREYLTNTIEDVIDIDSN